MVTTMIMQRMSVAMEYGVILKWLRKEGDEVKKGDPIVEIFGEKNEFELEAPEGGVLLKVLCEVNDEIPNSEPIAYIGKKDEKIPDARPRKLNKPTAQVQPAPAVATTTKSSPKPPLGETAAVSVRASASRLPGGRIMASPRAKMRAKERGIDISLIAGTGPEGRIVEKDIIAAKPPEESVVLPVSLADRKVGSVETLTPLRRTIARRMTQSAQNPHITMITEIDMTQVVALRSEVNDKAEKTLGLRVSFNDIIVKAVADTLEKFPRFNATLIGNDVHCFADTNVGVAMATETGLIVVTVRNANKKSVTQIAQETKELGKKAKENTLTPEEMTGSTFTVSNLGSFGVDLFIPIINPPETAILALGQIKKKPVVINDMIAVRSMMMASCAVDHRVLDGAPAGQFLAALKETLENPYFLKI